MPFFLVDVYENSKTEKLDTNKQLFALFDILIYDTIPLHLIIRNTRGVQLWKTRKYRFLLTMEIEE